MFSNNLSRPSSTALIFDRSILIASGIKSSGGYCPADSTLSSVSTKLPKTAKLTHKVVPYSGQLYQILELGMSQNLSRDRIFSRVLDYTLRLAILILLNLDDSGRKAILELFLVLSRDRTS